MPSRIFLAQRRSMGDGGHAVVKNWTPLPLNKQLYNGTSGVSL